MRCMFHPMVKVASLPDFNWLSQEQFDVIVIGGGSGGSGFSRRAAGYGKKVVIIDRGVVFDDKGNRLGAGIGGTCVNVSPLFLWFHQTISTRQSGP